MNNNGLKPVPKMMCDQRYNEQAKVLDEIRSDVKAIRVDLGRWTEEFVKLRTEFNGHRNGHGKVGELRRHWWIVAGIVGTLVAALVAILKAFS